MKHRSFFVIVASVASFLLLLYFVMVGYLFFARPADCAVVDWDLSIRPKMVPDCENKYIAYLALTNLTLTSDVSVLLSELHNVAACPQYQGPTNNILQLWTINEVSHIVDSAIGSLVKSGRYEDAAVAIYDWYTFAKSCCETSSSTVELVAGCGVCNMVYQEIENLALDEKVPEMILGTLSDIVNNEQNFKNLFERALKCEYSFWVKPGFEKLKQTPDQRELLARIENAFAPEGGGVVAQTLARVLACTPGYERFSYNNGATLQHVATVFRGAKLDVEIDFFEYRIVEGDIILMCTDGLSNMVEDEDVFRIIRGSRDLPEAVQGLIDQANLNGGKDNIGIVLAKPLSDEERSL